jgi:hypothetical protein
MRTTHAIQPPAISSAPVTGAVCAAVRLPIPITPVHVPVPWLAPRFLSLAVVPRLHNSTVCPSPPALQSP